jgi:type IV pilus assembly protein PilF
MKVAMNQETRLFRLSAVLAGVGACLILSGATCNGEVSEKAQKDSTIHLELSHNYLKEGDLISARREAILAIEKDPANSDAHYTLAYIFGQMTDWDNALSEVRLAIKHEKHKPEAENLLGVILMNKGQLDEAVEVLQKLTEDFLYPTPHLAYGNLGLAYYKKGEYPKALEALKKAVQLQPLFCVGYYRMGQVYNDMERYKDALDALEKCVAVEDQWGDCKRFQDAYILMGDIHVTLKTPDLALEDYKKCVEVDASNATGIECKNKKNKVLQLLGKEPEEEEGPGGAPAPAPEKAPGETPPEGEGSDEEAPQ